MPYFAFSKCNRKIDIIKKYIYSSAFCPIFLGDPKNITILGMKRNIVFAQNNHKLNLTCNVESGIPKETIIWTSNNKVLARGGPSSLTHMFTPIRKDHLKNFSCQVYTDSISIEKSVQLFLYCKYICIFQTLSLDV